MIKNNKGQAGFIGLLMIVMAFIIFFIALPFLNDFINPIAESEGPVVKFIVRLIPWVVLIFLSLGGLRLLLFGGGE